MSRERLYLDHVDAIEEVLRFTVRRHRCDAAEADDFAGWTRLRLVENDYAILASYAGRGPLRTFLAVVVQRLFLDYRRAQWGRWRPSEEARRLGPLAVRLETLTSRDGLTLEAAYASLLAVDPELGWEQIEDLAARLPIRRPTTTESDDCLDTAASEEPTPEAELIERQTEGSRRRAAAALPALLAELPAQDQLILRLRYAEGMKLVDIAARLRLEVKPLYRRVEKIAAQLRSKLEAQGFPAGELGWARPAPLPRSRAAQVQPATSRESAPDVRLDKVEGQ